MNEEGNKHFNQMSCEQCGNCCQNFYVLVTFTDLRAIIRHCPSLSLRNIVQLVEFPVDYPEQSILRQFPPIKIWNEKQKQEQLGYITLQWQESPSGHAICLFYHPDPAYCEIHGHHPKICQCYPFYMDNTSICSRPTRRCPHLYSLQTQDVLPFRDLWQRSEREKADYWVEIDIWHMRPKKHRTWRDLALFLHRQSE